MTRLLMTASARSTWCQRVAFSARFSPLRVKERHDLVKQGPVFRGDQVLSQCQQRPEHDVAVGIPCPDVPFPVEEHEPLGPVAVGVLSLEEADQNFPYGLMAASTQKEFHRPLRDVA
jgi:hypothetical protein